jgi:nicotinamide mononucleotide (NMN) deamidase PncC
MFDTWNKTVTAQADIAKYFTEGFIAYSNEFLRPLLTATEVFNEIESTRIWHEHRLTISIAI